MGHHSKWLTASHCDNPGPVPCFLLPVELLQVLRFNLRAITAIWLDHSVGVA